MKVTWIAPLILLAAACEADTRYQQSPMEPSMGKKNSIFKEGATPVSESSQGLQVFRIEDVEPSIALELEQELQSVELKARIANAASRPIRYAVADDALPQGADAVVLRDQSAAGDRMIVVSRATASDRLLSIARFALFHDEHSDPTIKGHKSILVWDDSRVQIKDKSTKIGAHFAVDPGEAKALLRQKGEVANLAGIGRVMTVRGQ